MKIAISGKGGVGKTILVSLVSRPFAEAGIEHLGPATARGVVELSRQSIETAYKIDKLAQEIDLHNIAIVANKVRSQSEKEFLPSSLPSFEFPCLIPCDQAIVDAGLRNLFLVNSSPQIINEIKIYIRLCYLKQEANGVSNGNPDYQ